MRSYRSVAFAVAWRSAHNVLHNPSLLLPGMAFPLLNFVAFVGGLSRLRHVSGFDYGPGYAGFQFAFVLLQSAAFGGVFTGFSIARDFEDGFSKRLLLAAPRRTGIVVGYAIGAVFRWLTVVGPVIGVAFATGMQVGGDGVDLFGLLGLALLVNTAFLLWAGGVAMRFRTIQAAPMMQTPVFLLLYFSPVYVPLELLRGWIHAVAVANPITRLLEAARSLLAGDPTEVAVAFGVGIGLIALFALWARGGLRSAEAAG